MIIPPERLAKQTLDNLLEEFITREGTDYGLEELSLEDKLLQLKRQLENGTVVIWFDSVSESTQLVSQEDYQQLLNAQSPEANNSADEYSSWRVIASYLIANWR